MDSNLIHKVYNYETIQGILNNNPIKKIFLTGKSLENEFRSKFRELIQQYAQIEIIALPSPSPAYATLRFEEKLTIYKSALPSMGHDE